MKSPTADCPSCDGQGGHGLDEEGKLYACYCCGCTGVVPLAERLAHDAEEARHAAENPPPPPYQPRPKPAPQRVALPFYDDDIPF
jgi:hypothetical protein